ncbi:MAG: RNA 2',3'-cyclic phosphodiesterase [Candidatus Ranarchaeia archaeon]
MAAEKLRVFISIDLPEILQQRVVSVQEQLTATGIKTKLVEPKNIHFTLKFIGDTPESKIASIRSALGKIDFSAYDLPVKGVGCFPSSRRPRIVWLGVGDETSVLKTQLLVNDINSILATLGIPKDPRPFRPHVTIARVRRPIRPANPEHARFQKFLKKNIAFDCGVMRVTEFCLKKSTLTPQGPIYSTLSKFTSKE